MEITIFMGLFVSVPIQRPPKLQGTNGLVINFSFFFTRNNKNAICQKCKEEDPNTLGEESLLAEDRVSCSSQIINLSITILCSHHWTGVQKGII